MKITIIQGAFYPVPPIRGGAVEKMWFELGKEFAREGHEVQQVSRWVKGQQREEIIDGVNHIRIDGFDTPSSIFILKLFDLIYTLRLLRRLGTADVVISNTFWYPLLHQAKFGKLMVDIQRMPKGQLRYYGKANVLRANSSAVREAILAELPSAGDRTVMIPNPLPFMVDDRGPASSIQEKRILYVGRIHPEKGLDVLLRAFIDLKSNSEFSEWSLDIVGPWDVAQGGGGHAYYQKLRQICTIDSVQWHGPVYEIDALARFYQRSSLFVYPSLAENGETFGLAPLEAMAWGAVPVVSDLACFRDFIKADRNGFIFNHRTENPENDLEKCLRALFVKNLSTYAEEAKKVRVTHSIRLIGKLFLEEFDRMNYE